jgi:hypothetical protein
LLRLEHHRLGVLRRGHFIDPHLVDEGQQALMISGVDYHALRIMGTQLGKANPFELLADRLPGAK